jgi:hypothetical protein
MAVGGAQKPSVSHAATSFVKQNQAVPSCDCPGFVGAEDFLAQGIAVVLAYLLSDDIT